MSREVLRRLEFDLAYLAMLTQRGIKPLSRWEARWGAIAEESLREFGLRYRKVTRTARTGKEVDELVFSKSQRLLDEYAFSFDGRPLRHSAEAMRTEGFLFGYPACCVTSFLARGYARNRLSRRDQRVLFHWACPECRVSPTLVPAYLAVHRECRRMLRPWPPDLRVGAYAEAVHQRVTEVGSWAAALMAMAALGLATPQTALSGPAPDLSHMLPTSADADADGLKDIEEAYFHCSPAIPDTDGNGLLDGYEAAQRLWQQIGALPTGPLTNAPYAVEYIAKGTVLCEVCGEAINMGYLLVTNPVEKTEVTLPLLAMHFMEHGGLTYRSEDLSFDGRVDPCRADIIANGHPAPAINASQGTVTLHWHGLSNLTYQVSTTVDLNSPWTPGPTYAGADAELEHVDTNAPAIDKKFYRLSW